MALPVAASCAFGSRGLANGVSALHPSRYRASTTDPDPNTGADRERTAIPGVRKRAPRRNALVALAYFVSFSVLAFVFGHLLGLVP